MQRYAIRCATLAVAVVSPVTYPLSAGERVASTPVERVQLMELQGEGSASQGVALGRESYYGADNRGETPVIHRFDANWSYLESQEFSLPGVNHIGALSLQGNFLWAGFLNAKGPRKSIVAKIRASDLSVVNTYDITSDVTWID
ncbi:MAG: hypothetical protein KDE30_07995, partial [Novosphingobium sp.]|nr:hypothetical protein [Novosphingobium sp.]